MAILAQFVGRLDDEREGGQEGLVGLLVYYGRRSWKDCQYSNTRGREREVVLPSFMTMPRDL